MSALFIDFVVAAPAEQVWEVIGRRFDRIGDWATAIPASTPIPGARLAASTTVANPPSLPAVVDAPVAGRVCQTGIRLVGEITETLTAYDDTNRTLTYQATGMPAFVTLARNTWSVIAIDARTCRVSLRARFETRSRLGRWIILAQTRCAGRHLAGDLRHYVETGTPSPRKQRRLRRSG